MKKLRGGRVVSVRVNPTDCLAVDDVVQKIGLYVPGMSFSQAVSIALAASMETFRKGGFIAVRDGFEYSQLMGKYPAEASRKRQYDINRAVDNVGSNISMPYVPSPPRVPNPDDKETRNQRIRFAELQHKLESAAESMDAEDHTEYARLAVKFT